MASTEASTYIAELSKLQNNMQLNTSSFKNCCTTIEEELDQKTASYGISTLGYVIHTSKAPVNNGDINPNKTLLEQCKDTVRLKRGGHHKDKNVVNVVIRKTCV